MLVKTGESPESSESPDSSISRLGALPLWPLIWSLDLESLQEAAWGSLAMKSLVLVILDNILRQPSDISRPRFYSYDTGLEGKVADDCKARSLIVPRCLFLLNT